MATSAPLSIDEDYPFETHVGPKTLSLDEFLFQLPRVLDDVNNKKRDDYISILQRMDLTHNDPVMGLFQRLDVTQGGIDWWRRYALFDSSRHYTRNLVATDYTNYTLLLLCWNPGRESPIHNHPCNGCWMKLLQGSVRETRYVDDNSSSSSTENSSLQCISDHIYQEGQDAFIEDSMGYHKVGNPSNSEPAITLHLYCPPFDRCKIWLGADARPLSSCVMSYYSVCGIKIGSDESMYI